MALIKKMKPERGKKNPETKGSETKGSNLVISILRELKMGISPIFRSRLARPQAPVGFEIGVNNWTYPLFSFRGVKDETSSATPVHDVIPGAWVFDSQRARHSDTLRAFNV